MHYFYLMLLMLSPIFASVSLKEKFLSILDASQNVNEKVEILQGLSKYLQDEQLKDVKENKQKVIQTAPTTQRTGWRHLTINSSTERAHWPNEIDCSSSTSCYTLPSYFTKPPHQIAGWQKKRYYTTKNNNFNKQQKSNITQTRIPFSKFTGNREKSRVTERTFFHIIPAYVTFKHRRLWEKSSFSSDEELKFSTKRQVREFELLDYEQPQDDVVNIVLPRPWGLKCGGPRQHDMLWGTCTLPEKCSEENRIHLGDNFCNKTLYICCTTEKQNLVNSFNKDNQMLVNSFKKDNQILVNAFKEEASKFTDTEDVNEANAQDNRKAAFIRKKLRRFKQMDSMLSLPFKKQYMDGVDLKPEKVEPLRENFKNAEYDVEFGRLYY